jgi:hypothetical protein
VVVVDALPGPGAAERDSGEWRARAVRLLRLGRTRLEEELKDPTVLADFAKDLGFSLAEKAGSCATAKALIWLRQSDEVNREVFAYLSCTAICSSRSSQSSSDITKSTPSSARRRSLIVGSAGH